MWGPETEERHDIDALLFKVLRHLRHPEAIFQPENSIQFSCIKAILRIERSDDRDSGIKNVVKAERTIVES